MTIFYTFLHEHFRVQAGEALYQKDYIDWYLNMNTVLVSYSPNHYVILPISGAQPIYNAAGMNAGSTLVVTSRRTNCSILSEEKC